LGQLVVADQRQLAAAEIEAAHPVGAVGHRAAVVHCIAQAREDAVGKARRQIDEALRVGNQAAVIPCAARRGEIAANAAACGKRGEGAAGGAEELAAVGRKHAATPIFERISSGPAPLPPYGRRNGIGRGPAAVV
jgi:hypothetical protein